MRKSLAFIVTLAALAFLASGAQALTKLTQQQVSTVCNGNTTYCEKKCGSNGEHTCGFGCGPKGCSGQCLTCPGSTSKTASRAVDSAVKGLTISSPRGTKTDLTVKTSGGTTKAKETSAAGPPKAGLLDSGASASKTGGSKTGTKAQTTTDPLKTTTPTR
jgi:hypothetical protein